MCRGTRTAAQVSSSFFMLCDDKPWILENMAAKPSYLIVGAGVFGVSTAYHLIKKYPDRQVTILDQDAYDSDNRVAASWDWNKVVRADYDDKIYCQLALEAQDIFEQDPLWQPYFHKTGIFWVCRSDYAQEVLNNYKALGRQADLQAVSIEDAKKLFGGLFEDANYDGAKEVLVNKTSGWAEAGASLRAVTKWSMEHGVKYITQKAESLAFDNSGRCTGVKTEQGNTISATNVILSTGAYTAKLLEQSAKASGNDNLRVNGRIVAGGITTGMTTLDEQSYKRFADMPVGVQGYTAATGPFIGSLPPTKDRELKWWGEKIFKNTHEVLPGRFVSAPPSGKDYNQWNVPGPLRQDIDHANHVFYGKNGATWKMEKHRICW
jgi:glycine/D-amino acid oxidase-like deaminating enzyme